MRRPLAIVTLWAAGLLTAGCGSADADLEPWDGTLAEGVDAMAETARQEDFDGALEVAGRMLSPTGTAELRARLDQRTRGLSESLLRPITRVLDSLGVSALASRDRAEIEFAKGVVLAAAAQADAGSGDPEAPEGAAARIRLAQEAWLKARRLAGGGVRAAAIHNLGTLELSAAEAVRLTIPEVAGADTAGPVAPPDPTQVPGEKDDADPLEEAREIYLSARGHFVECLRLPPHGDADTLASTQANVELVIRRLRELDEIERQRQEEQQQNQDSEDQDKSEDEEEGDQEQDPSSDESEDPSEESEESSEEESEENSEEESTEEPDPEEGDSEEDSEDKENSEEDPPEEEPENEEEMAPEEGKIEEKTMTAEEFQRLLEASKEHQERGEEIRRARRMRGKIPAKKDW